MSTRSNIGIINDDRSVDVVYCHWDGYPSYNGAVLLHHFRDEDKVRRLLRLGDISILAPKLEPGPGQEHTFEHPAEDVCLAYGRDRGEKHTEARHYESVDAYLDHMYREFTWVEHIYLFDPGSRNWLWSPCQHAPEPKPELHKLTEELVKEPVEA